LVDDRTEVLVFQTYIGRNDFVGVSRIVDIVAQKFHQADLGLVFDAELFVLGVFLKCQLGIACQIGQSGFLLEVGQLAFGSTELAVDNGNTVFNKVCGLLCHFVFLVVGILIIESY